MSKPTAAAMRAAKAVFGCDGGYGGCNKKDAETIDNATGLPELIAALAKCICALKSLPVPDKHELDAIEAGETALQIAKEGRS